MTAEVFEIVKELYWRFHGDVVQISKAFLGSWEEINQAFNNEYNSIEKIKVELAVRRLEPEDIKWSRGYIEHYVKACSRDMTLEEYEEGSYGEDIEGRQEYRWYTLKRDYETPIDEEAIDIMIYQLMMRGVDPRYIKRLVTLGWVHMGDGEFGTAVPEKELSTLKEIFATFWTTPEEVREWMIENRKDVDDFVKAQEESMKALKQITDGVYQSGQGVSDIREFDSTMRMTPKQLEELQNEKYKEAFSEVEQIFKLMPAGILKRIPDRFKEIIRENKSKNYIPHIHEPWEECNLKYETHVVLALIYREFLCSKEQRKEFYSKII